MRIVGRTVWVVLASLVAAFFVGPRFALAVTDYDSSQYIVRPSLSVEPNSQSGAFQQNYSFSLPAGRHGVQPSLGLTYSSADTSNSNEFGYGWSLSIPSIRRLPKHGTDDLYTRHDFTSTMSGELSDIVLSDATHGTFGAKVDDGSMLNYTYSATEVWTAVDKHGATYTFGGTSTARVVDPSDSSHVYEWMLTSVTDILGNTMTYTYTTSGAQVYPSSINYTGFGSTAGVFTVNFALESRSDAFTSYTSGFAVTTSSRVQAVTVLENAQTIRSYALAYGTGDDGLRSLLTSVTETATTDDGSSSLTKPATTFSYADGNNGWASAPVTFPETIAGTSAGSLGVYLFDMNGDAIPDIIKARYGSSRVIYTGNADGTWTLSTVTPPIDFASPLGKDKGVRVMDMNGDGALDLVQAYYSSTGTLYSFIYINNNDGTGWTLSTTASIPVGFTNDGGLNLGVEVLDVDGDGLPDLLQSRDTTTAVYINNGDGTGWTLASGYIVPIPFGNPAGSDAGSRILDVNGDGLPDLLRAMYSSTGTVEGGVYLNNGNGTGWTQDTSWTLPLAFLLYSGGDGALRSMDINGDGLPDLVRDYNEYSDYQSVYLNTGAGWTLTSSIISPLAFTNGVVDFGVRIDDFDGDGLPDYLKSRDTGSGAVNELYLASGSVADLMTAVTTSEGASMAVTYGSSVNGSNGSSPFVLQVVTALTTNNGLGNTATKTYDYAGGEYYGSYFEKKFAGFATMTATDSAGTTTKFFHQGNGTNSAQGESADSEVKIGQQYREERSDSSGHIYRTTIDSWDSTNLGTNRDFVYRSQTLELLYGSASTHVDTASTFTYDSAGNMTVRLEHGSVTGTDSGGVTDTGTDKRTTTTVYATDSTGVLRDMPAQVTVTNSAGTTIVQSKTLYDSLSYGSVSSGNVTTEQQWISGSTYASTLHTYDSYGNVLTTTAPNGGVKTVVYDTTAYQYPTTSTDAMSHGTTSVYSLSTGKPTSITNPNGSIVTTTYDAFGRPISESQSSDASASTMVATKTWSYSDASSPRSVTAREYLSGTVYKETISFLDGFDRTVETKTLDASGSGYNESQTSYDALGRVTSSTLPQATTSSSYESTAVASALAQTFSYDALSRVTSVVDVLGTTSTSYSGFAKTVTDARSKQKIYTTDNFGRLASVVEYISGTPYTTTYAYNVVDALTSMIDSLGNVRSFTYDGRGLRLTAQDLHASADTTFGTWTSTYDTSGNLFTSLSPNAITTTYTYDLLNRMSTEDASSTTGVDVTYGYDSCANGTGLLCTTAVNGGASTANVYTANSRVLSETKTIGGTPYITTTSYDYAGNPLTIIHPDNTIVRNTYNAIGALATVEKRAPSDTAYAMVTLAFAYGPDGQLTVQTNANGTVTTNTYDATKRYRLTRKVTTGFASSTTSSAPTTVTFYPSAGDGYAFKPNASWDTAHDAILGNGVSAPTATSAMVMTGKSPTSYHVYRSLLPFDTSSLPDDATITSATLNAYVTSKTNNDNDGDDFLTVVQSTQTSTATLATSDFSKTGATNNPTEGVDVTGRKDISNITSNAWLTFTLNATGQGFISKTSSSKFAFREGHDVIDSPFTSSSSTTSQYNAVYFRTSEYAGTTYDPVLSVTYTTPSSSSTTATNLQDLSYTYDAVGNILSIVDASNQATAKTTTYTYDDLSRVTGEAVTGAVNGDNTTITYAYNALGNITSRSDKGTYTYGGSSGTSYANPHAVTSILKTDGTTQTLTYDNNGNLTGDGTSTYTWDYKNRLTGSATVSSASTTTTTTVAFAPKTGDGEVYNGSSATWATTHDATSGSYADAVSTQIIAQTGKDSTGTMPYNIVRALFPFDTSSIPDTATITAATLSVYPYAKGDMINDAYDYMTVVQSTQPSTTTVATTDYSKVGAVSRPVEGVDTTGRKDLTSISTSAVLSFSLNATGRGFISKTSVTKLGIREGHDTANTSTGIANGLYNYLYIYSGEQTGTAQDPSLSVTYTTTSATSSSINPVVYAYDAFDGRVSKASTVTSTGVVTTSLYPTSSYSVDGTTTTVYIAGPAGTNIASLQNTGTTSSVTSTITTDHLGSTAVLSDSSGLMTELLDYHGFGNSRLTSGSLTAKKTFIGQYSDTESNLSYLNARYYDSVRGQFLSEDSVFLGMGTDSKTLALLLADPQSQNSYSYARNNPIGSSDPGGKSWWTGVQGFAAHAAVAMAVGVVFGAVVTATIATLPFSATALTVMAVAGGLGVAASTANSVMTTNRAYNSGAITLDQRDSRWGGAIGDVVGGAVGGVGGARLASRATGTGTASIATSGETSATRLGRDMHKNWNYGAGFEKEVRLDGGKMRVDALNRDTHEIVELKPNNPRSIRLGERQLQSYIQQAQSEFGGTWTGRVETYNK